MTKQEFIEIDNTTHFVPAKLISTSNNLAHIQVKTTSGYEDIVVERMYSFEQPPGKVVVPQDVARWYAVTVETGHDPLVDFINLILTMGKYEGRNPNYNYDTGLYKWIKETPNAIQIVSNMHQFGYEVEKEQLYVVTDGNKLYLKQFDELDAVIVIDDVLGATDYAKRYSDKTEAQKAADELDWIVKEVE